MRLFTKLFILVCTLTIGMAVMPSASASDWDRKTTVTFSAPVEVPGVGEHLLPAGPYFFKTRASLSDRHIVQIFSQDGLHLYTTILAIPNYRLRATEKTVMTFRERAQGEPEAIRAWFYPDRQWGEEFVYPKAKALELAKLGEPVLYTPMEVTSVEELKTARVEAVKPTGEAVTIAEVVQPPPTELPHTGSYLPLLAIAGLLSLGAAGLVSKYSV